MKKINIAVVFVAMFAIVCSSYNYATKEKKDSKPNVIIIFTDDQGYQDLGCYGSPLIKTPNIDQMASEGIRFTDFYVASSVCSASRASLLTGRYPARHGIGGAIFPEEGGLAPDEIILPELLKSAKYKTACFGKWHLGDTPGLLPKDQGFDEYLGIPYSNDMYIAPNQQFADNVEFTNGYTLQMARNDQDTVRVTEGFNNFKRKGLSGKVPLFEGDKVVEYPCEQSTLTERYFNRAIHFIKNAGDNPFFVYITPAMPHVPLYPSEKFKGKSERGLYGDVVEEIDANVGRLLAHLKESGLDENTIVIFSSDNGPWLKYGELGGSALPLRDGKGTIFEGGVRVPCIVRWPGKLPKGIVSHQAISAYDLVPTIASYAGVNTEALVLDGHNVAKHLEAPNTTTLNNAYVYFRQTKPGGIRLGEWKYLKQGGTYYGKQGGQPEEPMLFNLKNDPSETTNVIEQYPEVLKKLQDELNKIEMKL
ncbi:MAG: sulfatase [Carboxylicivirga sp.]|jgi:arylsulfatase A|nr:sulfatase [Carboxylicivirga sp.]